MKRQKWITDYCIEHGHIYTDLDRLIRTVKVLSFGDYDSSCHVERANVKVIEEEFPTIPIEYGHYGSVQVNLSREWIASLDSEEWDRLQEILTGLVDYPAIDDDACSEVEMELIDDAWNDFGRSDFRSELTRSLPSVIEEMVTDTPDDVIDKIWYETAQPGMHYFIESGGIVYFNVEAVADILLETE